MLLVLCGVLWLLLQGDLYLVLSCVLSLRFLSPFSIAITSLGGKEGLSMCFSAYVCFACVGLCLFPLPLALRYLVATCDCGTPWLFILPFFQVTIQPFALFHHNNETIKSSQSIIFSLNLINICYYFVNISD